MMLGTAGVLTPTVRVYAPRKRRACARCAVGHSLAGRWVESVVPPLDCAVLGCAAEAALLRV